jgi:hypothetical protein
MAERLVEEFARLVKEYGTAEGSEKAEAWNLIADFAVENSLKICLALDRTFPAKKPAEGPPHDHLAGYRDGGPQRADSRLPSHAGRS